MHSATLKRAASCRWWSMVDGEDSGVPTIDASSRSTSSKWTSHKRRVTSSPSLGTTDRPGVPVATRNWIGPSPGYSVVTSTQPALWASITKAFCPLRRKPVADRWHSSPLFPDQSPAALAMAHTAEVSPATREGTIFARCSSEPWATSEATTTFVSMNEPGCRYLPRTSERMTASRRPLPEMLPPPSSSGARKANQPRSAPFDQ